MIRVVLDQRIASGGAGRYGRELAMALRSMADLDIRVFNEGGLGALAFTPWGRRALRKAAIAAAADLVHGLHFEVPRGVPSVVTIQDLIPLQHPRSMGATKRTIFRRIVQRSIEHSLRIIVPSPLTADAVMQFGGKSKKVEIVPLWASDVFRPSTPAEASAARSRFSAGKRYIATLSHPRPHKNTGVLAPLTETVSSASGLPVVAAATGSLSDEDLRAFYGGSELFLLPSLIEGFGLTAVEALACGVPVVCGRGVGALPYIQPGVLVTDVGDLGALASAVARITSDESFRQRLSSEGLEAVSRLTLTETARMTGEVYQRALGL